MQVTKLACCGRVEFAKIIGNTSETSYLGASVAFLGLQTESGQKQQYGDNGFQTDINGKQKILVFSPVKVKGAPNKLPGAGDIITARADTV